MNIYLHELRSHRNSTIIWILALSSLVALFMAIYPPFSKDVEASQRIIAALPEPLRIALGIQVDTFFTLFGFYSYLLTFAVLVGAVQAMNLGVGIFAKEISGKTVDFLLSKPVTRLRVYASKVAATLTLLLLTNTIFLVVAYISAVFYSPTSFDVRTFIYLTLTLLAVQLIFLTLGFVISMLIPRIRSVIAISLPVVFGFFVLSMLDALIGKENIQYLVPFRYHDPVFIIQNHSFEILYLAIELVFVVAACLAAYWLYDHKDIRA